MYHLRQFHYHAPSEHTLNGKRFPMEVHFVHEDPLSGATAIFAILYPESVDEVRLAIASSHTQALYTRDRVIPVRKARCCLWRYLEAQRKHCGVLSHSGIARSNFGNGTLYAAAPGYLDPCPENSHGT